MADATHDDIIRRIDAVEAHVEEHKQTMAAEVIQLKEQIRHTDQGVQENRKHFDERMERMETQTAETRAQASETHTQVMNTNLTLIAHQSKVEGMAKGIYIGLGAIAFLITAGISIVAIIAS